MYKMWLHISLSQKVRNTGWGRKSKSVLLRFGEQLWIVITQYLVCVAWLRSLALQVVACGMPRSVLLCRVKQ